MPSLTNAIISLALFAASLPAATVTPASAPSSVTTTFSVLPADPGPWQQILSSVGFQPQSPDSADILVLRPGATAPAHLTERVEQGAFLILEGQTTPAESFGFRADRDTVSVVNVEDVHRPKLPIIWQKAIELHKFEIPKSAQIFAKERWTGAPLIAGYTSGRDYRGDDWRNGMAMQALDNNAYRYHGGPKYND